MGGLQKLLLRQPEHGRLPLGVLRPASFHGVSDGPHQQRAVHIRLDEIVLRAGLDGPRREFDILQAGQDHNRQVRI